MVKTLWAARHFVGVPAVVVTGGLVLIAMVWIAAYENAQRLENANSWQLHTQTVLLSLQELNALMVEAESGVRGFLLTGDDRYLERYASASPRILRSIDELARLTRDNATQQADLNEFRALAVENLAAMAQTVAIRRTSGLEASVAALRANVGSLAAADIRRLVAQMIQRERDLFAVRNRAASAASSRDFAVLSLWGPICWVLIAIGVTVLLRREWVPPTLDEHPPVVSRPKPLAGYLIAAATLVVATGVRSGLSIEFGPLPPFITYYPAVLAVALVSGLGPGIMATILAALLADYLSLPPSGSFKIDNAADLISLSLFILTSFGYCLLASALQAARRAQAVGGEQALLAVALARTSDGVAVCDAQGRITYLNEAAADLVGHSRAVPPTGPYQSYFKMTDSSGRPVDDVVQEITKPGSGTASVHRRVTLQAADGREAMVELAGAPVLETDGTIRGAVLTFKDFTEREQAAERFRLAMEAAPTGMFMVDEEGRIFLVNETVERLFGHSRQELVGRSIELLVPSRYRDHHPGLRSVFRADPRARAMGGDREVFGVTKLGAEIPIEIGLTPLETSEGRFIVGSIVDITERKRAMEQLRMLNAELQLRVSERTKELREREVLLQEIHHRVKNNLQVISSLINMQVRTLNDRQSRLALQQCQSRVETMALIHETLYQSRNYASIPFADYARDLAGRVFSAADRPINDISLEFEVEEVSLTVDRAIPAGLILNELVSNALKHAFPAPGAGSILIALKNRERGQVTMSVQDNGVGIPTSVDPGNSTTLGLQLVTTLIEQLDGQLEILRRGGTEFRATFPAVAA